LQVYVIFFDRAKFGPYIFYLDGVSAFLFCGDNKILF